MNTSFKPAAYSKSKSWPSSFIRAYLLLHFILLPFNGLSFEVGQSQREQGFSASSNWILEPSKLRRLSPSQERLPDQGSSFSSFDNLLYLPIFFIACACIYFFLANSKLYCLQSRWQLEGG